MSLAKEAAHRIKQPAWIASHSWRKIRESTSVLSRSEFDRLFQKVRPITMCSYARLHGLYQASRQITTDGIPGDVVECGVARGGSAVLIGLTLQRLNAPRTMWLFDTFSGMPKPSSANPDFEIADLWTGKCVGTVDDVSASLTKFSLYEHSRLVRGMFEETLPAADVSQIALLHIDGDWYESVRACLENLYDRVSPGGIIQFDDYGHWAGARKAVDEFLSARGIDGLVKLDYSGRQMRKAI